MPPADHSAITTPHAESPSFRRWMRISWDCFAMAGGIIYWMILGLLVTLIGGPLSFILPRRLGEPIGRWAHHCIFRYFVVYLRVMGLVRADLSGLDTLAKIQTPIIVAPNHTSLWDAVFIIARMPRAICVMKRSILSNPFLGGGSRLSGYIPNGGTSGMIRDAAASLRRGGQLLLFPEGTRTKPDVRWINPLKGGCALIAIKAQVPIYPVFIRSDTRYLQKGWPLWKRPTFPIRMSFELGEPVIPQEGESAAELTERLRMVYEKALARPHRLRRQVSR